MEYTTLGDTGLEVSRLCLGTSQLGTGNKPGRDWEYPIGDEERELELVDRAIDLGINFIDTANSYSTGESEELLGRAIEGRRDELVVSSKVGSRMYDRPNAAGLSRKHVLEQARASLDRLGTDYLDLYQPHKPDPTTPIEETLSALDHLVDEGLVHYLGASNFTGAGLREVLGACGARGYHRPVAIEQEYSLVAREDEADAFPVCADAGLGVMAYSPLAAGFLAGVYDRETGPGTGSRLVHRPEIWERLDAEENWRTLEVVESLAEEKGATPVQVSVAWLLERDVVDSVIVGPLSVEHLEEYAGALEVPLSEGEMERLEAPKSG